MNEQKLMPYAEWKAQAETYGYNTRQAFHTDSGFVEALNSAGKQVGLYNAGKKLGYMQQPDSAGDVRE